MILFALTSDIKQSTDYADLDSLLYGISNGEKKCLEQLYQVTHTSVYSFALSVLKNHHDAEDVLHDCYVAVWNGAESYVSRGKPMAWIITIAKKSVFAADEGAQESGMYIAGRLGTCYPGY